MKKIFLTYICTLCLLVGGLHLYVEKQLGPNLKKKLETELSKVADPPISIGSVGISFWPVGLQAKDLQRIQKDQSFILKKLILAPSFKSFFQDKTLITLKLKGLAIRYILKKSKKTNSATLFSVLASMPALEVNVPFLEKREAHVNLDIVKANIQLNINDVFYKIYDIDSNIQLRNHTLSDFKIDLKVSKYQTKFIPILVTGKYLLNSESLQITEFTTDILETSLKGSGQWNLKTNSRTGHIPTNGQSMKNLKNTLLNPFFKGIKKHMAISLSMKSAE